MRSHSSFLANYIAARENTLSWVRSCIDLYQRVQDHLGLYFLLIFSQMQLMWIESLFLAMSLPINSKTEPLPMALQCIGKTLL